MAVPSTSWEVRLELVDILREHIDELRALKLKATELRDSSEDPTERQALENLRCHLSVEERRQIRLYGEFRPAEMGTLN